jgi:hypothetical protein
MLTLTNGYWLGILGSNEWTEIAQKGFGLYDGMRAIRQPLTILLSMPRMDRLID